MSADRPISVLTVCTRNRTRSLLIAELLRLHVTALAARSHAPRVDIASAGTASEALAPIAGVQQQLHRFGITMSPHVGRQVTEDLVIGTDLILVSEPEHVVWIAGRWPEAYARTFTLPEVAEYIAVVGGRDQMTLSEWTLELTARRPRPAAYMSGGVAGILDPTGSTEDVWAHVTNEIDALTALVARSLLVS